MTYEVGMLGVAIRHRRREKQISTMALESGLTHVRALMEFLFKPQGSHANDIRVEWFLAKWNDKARIDFAARTYPDWKQHYDRICSWLSHLSIDRRDRSKQLKDLNALRRKLEPAWLEFWRLLPNADKELFRHKRFAGQPTNLSALKHRNGRRV